MLKAAALIAVFCSKFYPPWCFFFVSFNHEDVPRPKSQLPHSYNLPPKGGALGSREQITSQWVISTHAECVLPGILNLHEWHSLKCQSMT